GKPLDWHKPREVVSYQPNMNRYWFSFLQIIPRPEMAAYRGYFCRYLADQSWLHDPPGSRLVQIAAYWMLQTAPPPGQPWPKEVKVFPKWLYDRRKQNPKAPDIRSELPPGFVLQP